MHRAKHSSEAETNQAHWFATTHWSVVLAAGGDVAPSSAEALERLCAAYWYPVFAYLRRRGYDLPDAEDLTQSFFVHLLSNHRLQGVTPEKGKFRSFLLASLKNFLANEFDKSRRLKRGGQVSFLSLDAQVGEERYQREPSHSRTPDRAFEQSWALALLDTVLARLRGEHSDPDKARLFESFQVYLSGDKGGVGYAELGRRLQMSEAAVKMAVLRLRRRFGDLLREEIAHTVSQPEEIEQEIRCLFAAVSS